MSERWLRRFLVGAWGTLSRAVRQSAPNSLRGSECNRHEVRRFEELSLSLALSSIDICARASLERPPRASLSSLAGWWFRVGRSSVLLRNCEERRRRDISGRLRSNAQKCSCGAVGRSSRLLATRDSEPREPSSDRLEPRPALRQSDTALNKLSLDNQAEIVMDSKNRQNSDRGVIGMCAHPSSRADTFGRPVPAGRPRRPVGFAELGGSSRAPELAQASEEGEESKTNLLSSR